MDTSIWNRQEGQAPTPPLRVVNICGPEFARLPPSPANPEGLPEVNAAAFLKAPDWDDSGRSGKENPLIQIYESTHCTHGSGPESKLLKFLSMYDLPEDDLEKLAAARLPFGFKGIAFPTIAKFIGLGSVDDIKHLQIYRSRVNIFYFKVFQESFLRRAYKYGISKAFNDPSLRSNLVIELFYELTGMLPLLEFSPGSSLGIGIGYPSPKVKEAVIASLGVRGLVYVAVDSEAEKKNDSDGVARLLAEFYVCDRKNIIAGKWVPMLGILSDGNQFQFWVYNSVESKVWASRWIPGFGTDVDKNTEKFLITLKKIVEHLYDFFILMVINTMKIGVRETNRTLRENPGKPELQREVGLATLALNRANEAHSRFRKAERLRYKEQVNEAEIEVIDASKFMVPSLEYWVKTIKLAMTPVAGTWDRDAVLAA
ncbi:hypothetical protein TWF730_004512 [Orbilia blumenaviensis]|uniref:Uncharacterized protein n=1 Tax=Orbilia blumenaviensis TaxID=1796055 RepID=A0AAV9TYN6_9PEZI